MLPSVSPKKKKIFIIDDHAIVRDGLRRLFNDQEDLIVEGEAENARQAFTRLEQFQTDLVIADISMPGVDGIELIKNLRTRFPQLSIVVLSMHDEAFYAERALRAGAKGYLMKQASAETLLEAVRTILSNKVYLSKNLSAKLLNSMVAQKQRPNHGLAQLSDRELEILRLLGQGYTTREIGTNLCISTKTVESHRGNIRQKLKLKSGAELVRFALAHRDEMPV